MLSREEFETDVAPLRAALERRRTKYLRYYYGGVIAACLLIASAMLFPESALRGLQQGLHARGMPIVAADVIAYRIFALLFGCLLVLGPVMAYRGERGFSVEHMVMTRLLGSFGRFAALPQGALSGAELRRFGFSAAAFFFAPEAGVAGEMNQIRVRLSEAAFFHRGDGRDRLIFKGLIFLCETPPGTLKPMRNEASLSAVTALSEILIHERMRWDEKFAYAAQAFYAQAKETFTELTGKNELAAEKAYRLQYVFRPRFARAVPPKEGTGDVLPPVEYAVSACLAAVAGDGALFSLGSLFAPALTEAQMNRLYKVMHSVDILTRSMRNAREDKPTSE